MQYRPKEPRPKEPATSADAEDIQQELQDAHATGDGESNIWFYDWTTGCERLDILEGPATTQTQEGTADSVGTGTLKRRPLKKKE
jgi:hypothetical protein